MLPASHGRRGPHNAGQTGQRSHGYWALLGGGACLLLAGSLLVSSFALAGSPANSPTDTGRTLKDGVFSKPQARAGKKIYAEHCIACHKRSYFREVLRVREGETLAPLFEAMVTLMPQNAPGSLSDGEYVDVIAYIASQARYPEGTVRLQLAELNSITIPASD